MIICCGMNLEYFFFISLHFRSNILAVSCKAYAEMLKGNRLEPYKFIHKPASFLFSFNYADVDDCLPHIMQLLRAATLPTAEQNAMVKLCHANWFLQEINLLIILFFFKFPTLFPIKCVHIILNKQKLIFEFK